MATQTLMQLQSELHQIKHKMSLVPKGVKHTKTLADLQHEYEVKLTEWEKCKNRSGKNQAWRR